MKQHWKVKSRLLVAYIKETDIERVIIENSTKVEKVEIAPLFKENYTTKSGNRGQGLATVKRLIGHYPNVSLKKDLWICKKLPFGVNLVPFSANF